MALTIIPDFLATNPQAFPGFYDVLVRRTVEGSVALSSLLRECEMLLSLLMIMVISNCKRTVINLEQV